MEYRLSGNSVQIKELNETIKQVAPSNISVLITGESGTGKEVVANAIHQNSRRKSYPMIKVNCGAIPEGIIESELFGHQKGAFTGAIETRKGYFEMADNGTIFLDEIGEMPLSTQVKILRVLETGEFMRVGGDQNVFVDTRVIAATNRDLAREVKNKNFREDLYYRLKSVNLHIPPLRERKSDISLLFDLFVNNFCKENNIRFSGIDDDAMDYIINYIWYGNARELKNFAESIIVLNPDIKITLTEVKKHLDQDNIESRSLPMVALPKQDTQPDKDFILRALFELKTDILDLKRQLSDFSMEKKFSGYNMEEDFFIPKEVIKTMTFEEIEKEILIYFLNNNKWNINRTAEMLEVTPRTIYRKIKLYDIKKN